ncbi:hypothetical protein SDRG_04526 [Saprolegnia diclina VS20]|uniref:X8 domain-containing protein n=1 Tax=Saprolegnia diclina (strain VS20) TaxID=1156394 RepID=T0QTR1_SAPDV|nr:hypothetical protein SDRG_04526 [Saprolegnia diclina VS20]EQC38096.1 hypothetical protein SDRG_04526 [Saprolegnia diclina VS20]|eukprot:XP_008608423.1 hypothetical protein SDRG_04526 [Saprolegnia diclina VS20]
MKWTVLAATLSMALAATDVDSDKHKPAPTKAHAAPKATEPTSPAGIQFRDFVAHDDTQTCSQDIHSTPFNVQVRGTNLGGWLVLEPWITPTLFYQFLGTQERFGDQAPEKTAMDQYTFCTALGKEEANRQLRIHWNNWVTEADIKEMASFGVNSLRIPVGDWMFVPYEPYIGCTDGSIEQLDRVLDLCDKYNINVLIDIHGHIGSQNGFDNSGKTHQVKWTSLASTQPVGTTTFEHWPIRYAEWAGTFDPINHNYSSINYANLNQSLTVVNKIVTRYANHPAILGLQPVNEPWELTPIDVLKNFYWDSYKVTKSLAPSWKFVVHDSFRFGLSYWSQFMKGCPDIALDTHIYQAWMNPGSAEDFNSNACQQKYTISDMENALMPVIVGEWSVATDNCAMWLNGFNDNLPGFPKVMCTNQKCPVDSTYLGYGFPGTPLDVTKPIQGPYGTGTSGPSFGYCPVNSQTSFDKDHLAFTTDMVRKKLNAFQVGHGWYFWNFKTELDMTWNFIQLNRLGAFPKNVSNYEPGEVDNACLAEDKGEFVCQAKRGVKAFELENGLKYACNCPGVDCKDIETKYATLVERCDYAYNAYWHLERTKGATCDFGGSAHLISIPSNVSYATVDSIASADIAHATWNTLMASGGFILGGIVGVGLTVLLLTMHRKNAARKMYYGRNPSDVVLMGDRANGEERTPLVSKF